MDSNEGVQMCGMGGGFRCAPGIASQRCPAHPCGDAAAGPSSRPKSAGCVSGNLGSQLG